MLDAHEKRKTLFSVIGPSLVVVILAISIIFLIVNISRQARDSKRIREIAEIKSALQIYFSAHGFYPVELSPLVSERMIPVIPRDPSSGEYHYRGFIATDSGCLGYHLGASLEVKNKILDKDSDLSGEEPICIKNTTESNKLKDFSGSDKTPCSPSDKGFFCYDIQVQ